MEFVVLWPTPKDAVGEPGSEGYQPAVEPEVEFVVKRLPEIALTNAECDARGRVRKEGGDLTTSDGLMSWIIWRSYHLTIHMVPFIKSWKALDGGEMPKCIEPEIKAFLETMELHERVDLGSAYLLQYEEDKARPTKGANTDPAS